jgi:DNA repair exonuclease SbcCD ATPase subunit
MAQEIEYKKAELQEIQQSLLQCQRDLEEIEVRMGSGEVTHESLVAIRERLEELARRNEQIASSMIFVVIKRLWSMFWYEFLLFPMVGEGV